MKDETGSEIAVGCVAMIVSLVLSCALNGIACSTLWGWFVMPIFHLPAITAAQAVGLAFIVRVFQGVNSTDSDKYKGKTSAELATLMLAHAVVTPLMSLGFGWILKGFL